MIKPNERTSKIIRADEVRVGDHIVTLGGDSTGMGPRLTVKAIHATTTLVYVSVDDADGLLQNVTYRRSRKVEVQA